MGKMSSVIKAALSLGLDRYAPLDLKLLPLSFSLPPPLAMTIIQDSITQYYNSFDNEDDAGERKKDSDRHRSR